MSHFRLLKDPERYDPKSLDLTADPAAREYWLKHFDEGFSEAMKRAVEQYGREAQNRIGAAGEQFAGMMRRLADDPAALGGKLDVLALDRFRQEVLGEHRLRDPYTEVKDRANAAAAEQYPQLVRKLHAMDDEDKWLHLVRCVFAGNLFDLGAAGGPHLDDNPGDFLAAAGETKARPWLVDDYDRLSDDLLSAPPLPWGKAVVFVDNAGADFILGVMPLARELALLGTAVVLAANEGAALNDITVDETIAVVEELMVEDPDLAALINARMFEVVSSGSHIPMLDLAEVPDELNEAASDADLVVLEGMGRAVETNFDTAFTTDCLRLALLKDPDVAARLGGEPLDCVCKYVRADS